jgi:anti-sigma factor RsiW
MSRECEAIQERLSAHLDGELSQTEVENLHRHLSICENCQSLLEDYSKIGRLLREQATQQTAGVNLASMKENVLEQIAPAAHIRQTGYFGLDIRRYRWPLIWVLGLTMAVVLIRLGPQVREISDQPEQTVFNGSAQAQLGRAIRDAAGIRFAVVQATDHYQEQLGRLIRDSSRDDIQEQLGLLIRDYARSQWNLKRQSDQLQERLGLLIQIQARQHQDS